MVLLGLSQCAQQSSLHAAQGHIGSIRRVAGGGDECRLWPCTADREGSRASSQVDEAVAGGMHAVVHHRLCDSLDLRFVADVETTLALGAWSNQYRR